MFCGQCGAPLPAEARYCGACGAAVELDQPAGRAASAVPAEPTRRPRVRGRQRSGWLVVVAVIAGLAAAAAAVLVFVFDRSGEPTLPVGKAATATTAESPQPRPPEYAELVRAPLERLSELAAALGRALADVDRPADISRVRRAAGRELDTVRGLARSLDALAVSAADEVSHGSLLEGVALHEELLRLLVRATSANNRRALAAATRAEGLASQAVASYREFLRLQPALPDLITGSGMDAVSALRFAVQVRLVTARARPTASRRYGATPAVYSGFFAAVDRLERCHAASDAVACSAGPSGKVVTLEVGRGVSYEGRLGSSDNGGPAMPHGASFRTPAGTIECDSSTLGITCVDLLSGAYFVIGDYVVRVFNGGAERRF